MDLDLAAGETQCLKAARSLSTTHKRLLLHLKDRSLFIEGKKDRPGLRLSPSCSEMFAELLSGCVLLNTHKPVSSLLGGLPEAPTAEEETLLAAAALLESQPHFRNRHAAATLFKHILQLARNTTTLFVRILRSWTLFHGKHVPDSPGFGQNLLSCVRAAIDRSVDSSMEERCMEALIDGMAVLVDALCLDDALALMIYLNSGLEAASEQRRRYLDTLACSLLPLEEYLWASFAQKTLCGIDSSQSTLEKAFLSLLAVDPQHSPHSSSLAAAFELTAAPSMEELRVELQQHSMVGQEILAIDLCIHGNGDMKAALQALELLEQRHSKTLLDAVRQQVFQKALQRDACSNATIVDVSAENSLIKACLQHNRTAARQALCVDEQNSQVLVLPIYPALSELLPCELGLVEDSPLLGIYNRFAAHFCPRRAEKAPPAAERLAAVTTQHKQVLRLLREKKQSLLEQRRRREQEEVERIAESIRQQRKRSEELQQEKEKEKHQALVEKQREEERRRQQRGSVEKKVEALQPEAAKKLAERKNIFVELLREERADSFDAGLQENRLKEEEQRRQLETLLGRLGREEEQRMQFWNSVFQKNEVFMQERVLAAMKAEKKEEAVTAAVETLPEENTRRLFNGSKAAPGQPPMAVVTQTKQPAKKPGKYLPPSQREK